VLKVETEFDRFVFLEHIARRMTFFDLCDSVVKSYMVLRELLECSECWSEYDVPLGLRDRIKDAAKFIEGFVAVGHED
jgi:hypothetical protein